MDHVALIRTIDHCVEFSCKGASGDSFRLDRTVMNDDDLLIIISKQNDDPSCEEWSSLVAKLASKKTSTEIVSSSRGTNHIPCFDVYMYLLITSFRARACFEFGSWFWAVHQKPKVRSVRQTLRFKLHVLFVHPEVIDQKDPRLTSPKIKQAITDEIAGLIHRGTFKVV